MKAPTNLNCRRCGTAIEKRRIPFGKTGTYVQLVGCACQAMRMFLLPKFDVPEDRKPSEPAKR
jgi:hypothetical protein